MKKIKIVELLECLKHSEYFYAFASSRITNKEHIPIPDSFVMYDLNIKNNSDFHKIMNKLKFWNVYYLPPQIISYILNTSTQEINNLNLHKYKNFHYKQMKQLVQYKTSSLTRS